MRKLYLEFVRGVAAIIVMLTHLESFFPWNKKLFDTIITGWGTAAVIMFFILSGVVINISYSNKPRTRLQFAKNRFLRIYPQFLFSLVLAIVVTRICTQAFPGTRIIVGNLLMLGTPSWYIVRPIESNFPVWSLTYEMFFYFIFTLVISSKIKSYLKIWFSIALIATALSYVNINSNVLKHFISMFAFSSIWLVGYYIYKFRDRFNVNFITACFSLGMLPLIPQLNFSSEYYDPIKFLLFAIAAIPFFRFCMQTPKKGIEIKVIHLLPIYVLISVALVFCSTILPINKAVYIAFPFALSLIGLAIRSSLLIKNKLQSAISKTATPLGKYSYSIYIIHHPVLILCSTFFHNFLLIAFSTISITVILAYCLEKYYQPFVISLFSKKQMA